MKTRIVLHLDERDRALTESAFWRTTVIAYRKPHAKRDNYDGSLCKSVAP